ncbi:MAG TPA: NepR family anti-sigma factor [Devosia sp.]|nr:NepR family anti-sigma factor [Sphingomonadaceae bacterium]HTO27766.1 NepR family anti-sigma factor [Devosia sp.]
MSEASDSPEKTTRKPGSGKRGGKSAKAGAAGKGKKPEWADGLKRLYDSVVEEPLPDAFNDLLSRLDDGKP